MKSKGPVQSKGCAGNESLVLTKSVVIREQRPEEQV